MLREERDVALIAARLAVPLGLKLARLLREPRLERLLEELELLPEGGRRMPLRSRLGAQLALHSPGLSLELVLGCMAARLLRLGLGRHPADLLVERGLESRPLRKLLS